MQKLRSALLLTLSLLFAAPPAEAAEKTLPLEGEVFEVKGHPAFLILPKNTDPQGPIPWVWYAPTLKGLPGNQEVWMFERFLAQGIAIAGIDVGESYGSPDGTTAFSALYQELVENRRLSKTPALLARSRGGLMLYNWATENPDSVACIAAIYPVCNLASYPGLRQAAPAYKLTEKELTENLATHNPINRLAPLAKAKIPIFHLHGDQDKLVPLKENSAKIKDSYDELGGPMTLEIPKGQGHNLWPGFFQSQTLTDFIIKHAH